MPVVYTKTLNPLVDRGCSYCRKNLTFRVQIRAQSQLLKNSRLSFGTSYLTSQSLSCLLKMMWQPLFPGAPGRVKSCKMPSSSGPGPGWQPLLPTVQPFPSDAGVDLAPIVSRASPPPASTRPLPGELMESLSFSLLLPHGWALRSSLTSLWETSSTNFHRHRHISAQDTVVRLCGGTRVVQKRWYQSTGQEHVKTFMPVKTSLEEALTHYVIPYS